MFPALLPKSAPFFSMLAEQNNLLRRMAALLVNMLEDVSNMDHVHKEIAFLEEEADLLHSVAAAPKPIYAAYLPCSSFAAARLWPFCPRTYAGVSRT